MLFIFALDELWTISGGIGEELRVGYNVRIKKDWRRYILWPFADWWLSFYIRRSGSARWPGKKPFITAANHYVKNISEKRLRVCTAPRENKETSRMWSGLESFTLLFYGLHLKSLKSKNLGNWSNLDWFSLFSKQILSSRAGLFYLRWGMICWYCKMYVE